MTSFQQQFQAARRASTPIIAVRTPDPAASVESVHNAFNGKGDEIPFLIWDVVRGVRWLNNAGLIVAWRDILQRHDAAVPKPNAPNISSFQAELTGRTLNLTETLSLVHEVVEGTVLFISNAQLFIKREDVLQAVWNLRDVFKQDQRTLILLGPLGFSIPTELANDVLTLDEPLPTLEELGTIVQAQWESVTEAAFTDQLKQKSVDAICGLASFPAEQVVAMSLVKRDGKITIDTDALWERKRKTVEQIPGLSVWREPAKFNQIGGLDNLKQFLTDIMHGAEPPRCIVFIDEIEKALAGATGEGDSSGTSQEMHGTLLAEMENQHYTGLILVGPPGTCKSQVAKAAGGEAGIPVIVFDLSAMKSKFVGSSNEQLNAALQVIRAVSQGQALFIATCNRIKTLPPELKRRFKFGTFYIDLPTKAERDLIWAIYILQFGLDSTQTLPESDGWTGAEIKSCCELAWRLKRSLVAAAAYITPISRIAADEVENLRQQANGRFLSASYEGFYTYNRAATSAAAPAPAKARAIKFAE